MKVCISYPHTHNTTKANSKRANWANWAKKRYQTRALQNWFNFFFFFCLFSFYYFYFSLFLLTRLRYFCSTQQNLCHVLIALFEFDVAYPFYSIAYVYISLSLSLTLSLVRANHKSMHFIMQRKRNHMATLALASFFTPPPLENMWLCACACVFYFHFRLFVNENGRKASVSRDHEKESSSI